MRNYRRTVGKCFSEGARLTWAELARRRMNIASGAKLLGWHRGQFSRALYGDGVPGIHLLSHVKRVFGVAPEAWAEPPSDAFIPPAMREATEEEGAA